MYFHKNEGFISMVKVSINKRVEFAIFVYSGFTVTFFPLLNNTFTCTDSALHLFLWVVLIQRRKVFHKRFTISMYIQHILSHVSPACNIFC